MRARACMPAATHAPAPACVCACADKCAFGAPVWARARVRCLPSRAQVRMRMDCIRALELSMRCASSRLWPALHCTASRSGADRASPPAAAPDGAPWRDPRAEGVPPCRVAGGTSYVVCHAMLYCGCAPDGKHQARADCIAHTQRQSNRKQRPEVEDQPEGGTTALTCGGASNGMTRAAAWGCAAPRSTSVEGAVSRVQRTGAATRTVTRQTRRTW